MRTLIALSIVAAIAVVALQLRAAAPAAPATGTKAPLFSLKDQNGKAINLADYGGKVVVLEWFNDGCPFVQKHYTSGSMNKTASKYKSDDVIWLAINSSNFATESSNKAASEKWSIGRPILDDHSGQVGHLYKATNTPEIYVIGKDGDIAYTGAIDNNAEGDQSPSATTNYAAKAIDEILAGKPVSVPVTKPYGCSVKYAE